jgi:hypothetical protein
VRFSNPRMWLCAMAAVLVTACTAVHSRAADFSDYVSLVDQVDGASRQNSVLVFGGRMSTTNLASTLLFNSVPIFGLTPYHPYYDNYTVGGAYQRDVYRIGGFVIAGEIGIDDRFGHYSSCCAPVEPTVISSNILNSGELWLGPAFRYEAIVLFDTLRITPGFTAGFSAVTNSIGAEEGHVIFYSGNATFLGYLGFEAAFSFVSAPALELVIAEHHRSGADGLLGRIHEGYNSNVAGLRYRF